MFLSHCQQPTKEFAVSIRRVRTESRLKVLDLTFQILDPDFNPRQKKRVQLVHKFFGEETQFEMLMCPFLVKGRLWKNLDSGLGQIKARSRRALSEAGKSYFFTALRRDAANPSRPRPSRATVVGSGTATASDVREPPVTRRKVPQLLHS
jgi:hypothetical protein